jgi:microcystin degradation protein MlrC
MSRHTARRVALAGFVHESNSFAPTPAGLAAFRHGGGYLPLSRGAEIIARARGVNLPICGAVEHGEGAGWEMIPTLYAGALPSAPVTEEAYRLLGGELVDSILAANRAKPLDAVFLDLHGAMVAANEPDGEGALLKRLRAGLGPNVKMVAALDLHGNITPAMVEAADALVGFRTYPHVDMRETGLRAAALLDRLMQGAPCFKAFRQIDFLIPISWQSTLMQPGQALYAMTEAEERDGVASVSLFMGFPAADFEGCGPCVVAYGETQAKADAAAARVARAVEDAEDDFRGEAHAPEEGVRRAVALAQGAAKPVVLADTQDNPGAGGDSDTTGMLRALIACDAQRAAIGLMVDAEAAAQAHEAGEGAEITLTLGGRSRIPGDAPFTHSFVVEKLSDGRFVATGPFYAGAKMELGRSACLRARGVRVVLTSEKTQLADREMFRFVGIQPEEQAILVVKSSVHFRADFQPYAEAILTCVAPGPMPISPAALPFTRLREGMKLEPKGKRFSARRSA